MKGYRAVLHRAIALFLFFRPPAPWPPGRKRPGSNPPPRSCRRPCGCRKSRSRRRCWRMPGGSRSSPASSRSASWWGVRQGGAGHPRKGRRVEQPGVRDARRRKHRVADRGRGHGFVLVFKTARGVEGILKGKYTLGADASVAAGPVGRSAKGGDRRRAEGGDLLYSRSRGLFAGVSLEGSSMQVDDEGDAAYYGAATSARTISWMGRTSRSPLRGAAEKGAGEACPLTPPLRGTAPWK